MKAEYLEDRALGLFRKTHDTGGFYVVYRNGDIIDIRFKDSSFMSRDDYDYLHNKFFTLEIQQFRMPGNVECIASVELIYKGRHMNMKLWIMPDKNGEILYEYNPDTKEIILLSDDDIVGYLDWYFDYLKNANAIIGKIPLEKNPDRNFHYNPLFDYNPPQTYGRIGGIMLNQNGGINISYDKNSNRDTSKVINISYEFKDDRRYVSATVLTSKYFTFESMAYDPYKSDNDSIDEDWYDDYDDSNEYSYKKHFTLTEYGASLIID